jgi:predicted secreted protein
LNLPSAQVTTGVDGRAPFPIFDGSITSEFANAGTVILPGEEGSPRTFDVVFPINEDVALVEPPPAIVHLTGTIRDAAGNPVPGATLVVSGEKAVQEAETNSEGFYSLTTVPGVYGLVIEGHGNGLPPKWSVEIFLDLQRDKELNVNLPPTSTVTVEVLGTHGSPVTGATVGMPVYVSERADFGGLEPTAVESFLSLMATGKDGRATFLVFDGSPIKFGFRQHSQPGKVEPPSGSGYPSVEFAAPTVEADTATVVRLAGPEEVEEEESPPKEEETGPEEEETATGGPELTELFFESPEIDTGSEGFDVRVFARLIDGGGQIEKGFVTFERPSGEEQIFGSLERVSESESGAVLEGNAFFPRESEDGRWLATVHVFDSTGHELVLGPEELSVRGFVDAVDVVNSEPRAPVVTGISPNSGPETGGTEVIVSGTDFGGATAVHFGGSVAEFIPKSAETIIAFAPPGTGTADVTVTTSAGTSPTSEADRFTYTAPAPTVTLTSSPDPSVRGQKVTFVATVTSAGEGQPTPIGTVSFVEGSSTLGVVNLSKGVGKLSTTTLGAGEHPVVAEYGGDSHHSAANSAPLVQVVTKATTELTLSSSLNPAAYGGSATLKAHIAAVAPGAGTPAGTVTFLEGEAILETVQMSGGNATLKLKALAPGTHKITASYSGDANDEPSEGGPFVQTITAARTQLNLTSTLNPAAFGSAGTLKATVSSEAPGGGTPAGNVIFREGETVLATVPLSAGSAKYALKSIEPGEPKITATYGGEADYEASSDELLQVIVPASTEMTLTSSKNPAPHGSTGTLKATVRTLAPGGGTAAGTVTFREGETVLAVIPLSGAAATYPLKSLPAGEHKITAAYAGNADYEGSGATIVQVITP